MRVRRRSRKGRSFDFESRRGHRLPVSSLCVCWPPSGSSEGGRKEGREASSGLLLPLPPFSTTGRPQGKYCREVTRRREETEGGGEGEGGERERRGGIGRRRPLSTSPSLFILSHQFATIHVPFLSLFLFV